MDNRQKETPTGRLGRLLAYLITAESSKGENRQPPATPADESFIEKLKTRRQALLRSDGDGKWSELCPDSACLTEQSYLEGNVDFFVSFVTVASTSGTEFDCQKLMRHMNDCFRCFNTYVEVLDAYHEASNGQD